MLPKEDPDAIDNVRHDLLTPLTPIRSLTEILLQNPDIDSKQKQRFLRIILDESNRLVACIDRVLEEIERGRNAS